MRKIFDKEYPVTQRFGENPQDYAQFGIKGHDGWDFATPTGTPCFSPLKGSIARTGNDLQGFGLYVRIEDGKQGVLFAHLREWVLQQGMLVKEGDLVGYTDNTGNSTGPHCHFGYYTIPKDTSNGYAGYLDPNNFLEGGVVMNPLDYLLTGPDYVSLGVQDKPIDHSHNVGTLIKDLGLQLDINSDLSKKVSELTISNNELQNTMETAASEAKRVVDQALADKNTAEANLTRVQASLDAIQGQVEFDQALIGEHTEHIKELEATISTLQEDPLSKLSPWQLITLGVSRIFKK